MRKQKTTSPFPISNFSPDRINKQIAQKEADLKSTLRAISNSENQLNEMEKPESGFVWNSESDKQAYIKMIVRGIEKYKGYAKEYEEEIKVLKGKLINYDDGTWE